MLNFTFYDPNRGVVRLKQAGRGGIGRVFRHKKIKAVVCKYQGIKNDLNNVHDISIINKTGVKYHREMATQDPKQNNMRKIGTANTMKTLNDYDILPTHNFKFGGTPNIAEMHPQVFILNLMINLIITYPIRFLCSAKVVDGYYHEEY